MHLKSILAVTNSHLIIPLRTPGNYSHLYVTNHNLVFFSFLPFFPSHFLDRFLHLTVGENREYWVIRSFFPSCERLTKRSPWYRIKTTKKEGVLLKKRKKNFSICPKVKAKPTAKDKIHTSFKQLVRNVQRLYVQSAPSLDFQSYVEAIEMAS